MVKSGSVSSVNPEIQVTSKLLFKNVFMQVILVWNVDTVFEYAQKVAGLTNIMSHIILSDDIKPDQNAVQLTSRFFVPNP